MNFHRSPFTYVEHIHLKVANLERSIQFYTNVIGFSVLHQTDTEASLTADGQNALITLEQPENVVPKIGRTTGLYHVAILLPSRLDLANFIHHLIQLGLEVGAADHLVSEAIYFSDPDGNGIEIYRDREPNEWDWRNEEVIMATDPLDFNGLIALGKQDAWQGLPKETVIGHLHLQVAELVDTKKFYTEGFGYDIVSRFGRQALFLSDGKYHHHVAINTWAGEGAPRPHENSVGLKSYTIHTADEEQRRKIKEQLESISVTVENEQELYVVTDPSGHQVYF